MCVYLDNFEGFLKSCQQSIFKLNNQDKICTINAKTLNNQQIKKNQIIKPSMI